MRKLLAALLLSSISLFAQSTGNQTEVTVQKNQTITGQKTFTPGATLGPIPFSSLNSVPRQADGTMIVISDGAPGTTCSGGGNGALATYLNGNWNCAALNGMASTLNNAVLTGSVTTPITNGGVQCLHVDNGGVLSGTGVDCGAGGGGGGGTVSQIGTPTVGQHAVFTDTTHIKGQDKLILDARDLLSLDCTGGTDHGPALTTLTDNVSGTATSLNGKKLVFPASCTVNVGSGWTIRNLSAFEVSGPGTAGSTATNTPVFKYTGTAGGTAISMDHVNSFRVSGIAVDGNKLADTGISVDEASGCGGCLTTYVGSFVGVHVSDSTSGTTPRTGWSGIYISPTSVNDVADIKVIDSGFYCHATSTTSAALKIGNSFNAKNEIFQHNNLSSACAYGIWALNGNFVARENNFGNNQIASIRVDQASDDILVERNSEEADPQFFVAGYAPVVPVTFLNNHIAPGSALNAAVYQVDVGNLNPVSFIGNSFTADANVTKVLGSGVVGAAGPSITAFGNKWPNATFFAPWSSPSSGNQATGSWVQGPTAFNRYLSDSLNLLDTGGLSDNMVSPSINFIGRTGNRSASTSYGFQAVPNGPTNNSTNSTLALTQQGFSNGYFATNLNFSGLKIAAVTAPVWQNVSTRGTAGSTSYTYAIVAHDGSGTVASATQTIATGNATLNGANYNFVAFYSAPGAAYYDIYRTASGGTPSSTGKIGSVYMPLPTGSSTSQADNITFSDTGLAGNSASLPVTNTTGQLVAASGTLTIPSDVVANNIHTGNLILDGTCTGCGGGGGSGTVTSVATTSPITGGPFSTTGTIDCPTCLVASTPGNGVLHIAASPTQTAASSPVVDADLSGQVAINHGGTGAATAANALIGLLPAGTRVGDMLYCKTYASSACTLWDLVPGNGTGSTGWLQETLAGTPSWTIPPGSGTVVVKGAGDLADNALMTGGLTQNAQTICATCTLDVNGNLVTKAGGSIGSADTGTPKITFGTNLMTANKPIAGTIFNASTGYQVGGAATLKNFLRGDGTNFVSSAILAGDLPSLSGTYLALSGGGTMNGNILFTDQLYNVGGPTNRALNGYFYGNVTANGPGSSVSAPAINATTGFQIGATAPAGHFLCGTGTYYADCGRLVDDGSTLSYPGELQVGSFSVTTAFQIDSSWPAGAFPVSAANHSGFGVASDGNFYVSNNGGASSQVLTLATNLFSGIASGTSTGKAFVMGTGSSLAPTSATVGTITANNLIFGSTSLPTGTLPTTGQCLYYNGTNVTGGACSGGGGMTWPSGSAGLPVYGGSSAWGTTLLSSGTGVPQTTGSGFTLATVPNSLLANSSTTVNGQACALGSACNVITAASGQLAVSGGSGSPFTGAPSLTYSGSTLSTTAAGVVDLSASTGTAALIVPANAGNTAGAAGVIDYDTTSANYHINNGGDALLLSVPAAASITNSNLTAWQKTGNTISVTGAGILKTDVVTAGSAAGAANQVAYSAGASKALSFAVLDSTVTHVLHATNPPAFGAIVAGDLPATLSSGTAITNAALTTPNLGTPSAGTLTNVTGLPIGGIVATGTPSATTYLRGDGTWSTATGSNGLSGMVSGQAAIANSSNTVTGSYPLAGAGAGLTTGPASATTAGHIVTFTGTTGQIQDGTTPAVDLVTAASTYTAGQFIKAAASDRTTSSAAIAAADLPAALANSTSINGVSVASGKTLVYTDSTSVNGTTIPASATLLTTTSTAIPIGSVGSSGLAGTTNQTAVASTGVISLATAARTRSCEIVVGGTGAANILQTGDATIANNSCFNKTGVTWTITGIYAKTDGAGTSMTVNPTYGATGTGTTILAGALTAGASEAYSTMTTGCSAGACTVSNASVADGSGITIGLGGSLTGTDIHVLVTYTMP